VSDSELEEGEVENVDSEAARGTAGKDGWFLYVRPTNILVSSVKKNMHFFHACISPECSIKDQ
jgi:hypothetical protein